MFNNIYTASKIGFVNYILGFPSVSVVENISVNAGDTGWIPASERSPGEGNSSPFQYSSLENPMVRGVLLAAVHGVTKESDTT